MKLPILISISFFFLILKSIKAIVSIPLKPSFSEAHRNKFLFSLKLLQINAKNPSFLQEVPLHQQVIAQKRLATYYGDIGVGTGVGTNAQEIQSFKMLFDTGSCEFWIPSYKCTTTRCLTHQRYSISNTFQQYNGAAMSIQYLSGKVQGEMAKETIHVGDLVVPGQVIGIAHEVQIPLLDEVIWDGILGLAYPNANLKRQKIKPLFDNIISQGLLTNKAEKNQFAYYLGPEKGAITFGGADMKFKKSVHDEFLWAPISEENYWTISLLDVRFEDRDSSLNTDGGEEIEPKRKLCPNGCKAIIDTGTYLIYGPSEVLHKYFKEMSLDSCDRKKDLPNIIFEFKGEEDKSIELIITPEDYVLEFKIDGQDDCVIGIGADGEDSGWTLGQVFLKAFYTIFDRDNNRIGFVRANSDPNLLGEKIYEKKEEKGGLVFNNYEKKEKNRKLFKNTISINSRREEGESEDEANKYSSSDLEEGFASSKEKFKDENFDPNFEKTNNSKNRLNKKNGGQNQESQNGALESPKEGSLDQYMNIVSSWQT